MIKVLWVMLRSTTFYFSTFRRNLPPSYSSSRVHLSLKVNPVPFFETSAVIPAVEHRGTQRTNHQGKRVLQRSQATVLHLYYSFILQSLATGPHPLLHRVPLSVSDLNFLFSLNAIQYQLTSFSSSSRHLCLSYLSFSNVF